MNNIFSTVIDSKHDVKPMAFDTLDEAMEYVKAFVVAAGPEAAQEWIVREDFIND